jgi:hypothetical protein
VFLSPPFPIFYRRVITQKVAESLSCLLSGHSTWVVLLACKKFEMVWSKIQCHKENFLNERYLSIRNCYLEYIRYIVSQPYFKQKHWFWFYITLKSCFQHPFSAFTFSLAIPSSRPNFSSSPLVNHPKNNKTTNDKPQKSDMWLAGGQASGNIFWWMIWRLVDCLFVRGGGETLADGRLSWYHQRFHFPSRGD